MLTPDTALQIAYVGRPDMLVRVAEFVTSYALHDRPALIAHASPENRALEIDLADDVLQTTLRQGSGGSVAWWEGFDAPGGLRPTFRGLACRDSRDDPRWAFEMHRDGSLIAGVWTFPEAASGQPCLAAFYAQFFEDFSQKAIRLTTSLTETYRLTATLVQANCLPFSGSTYTGRHHPSPPPRVATLQWPLRTVSLPESWRTAVALMNAELFGAYGHIFRPTA